MIMVIGPHKKKAEAKAEQRKRRADEAEAEGTGVPAGSSDAGTQENGEQA
jgi:hypothetical protein